MRIVFFGTPQFAVPSLTRLLNHSDFEVVAVVTQPDKRRGRGGKVSPSPVKAAALTADCPIWQPSRIKKDDETLTRLNALNADAFVVIAYGQILSQEILDMPGLGCINAHGSILPAYRGAAPIQWCLHNGETKTGVTTMLMDAGMDTGPMLLKETLPIGLTDNAWNLAQQLSELSADLLASTLQKLNQQLIRPVPQDDKLATYAPLIKKEDYALDWSASAKAIHDKVRGFYPNCITQLRGNDLKVITTIPLGDDYWAQFPAELATVQTLYESAEIGDAAPGTVVAILKSYGPVIQTGTGHLLLLEVKPAGKKALSGWDFANGSRLEIGEMIGE
ncbi:methionyl-tRNA formyltransferase [cf. Phormidesmis sp. LEGE 11477]|uniref:methionyl-tRNA formyltransferase n=1 Tax=cf. Phormidesmis sp. LEGE 11477 TaxID=1828680 RepID=UPI001882DD7B|nr:methionyl-tRNA formyltransferase [cf. Phormidesmis sp. LEGE 11477]MBE9063218.1 methionyl-tRNA formyltransferase [cf. Phormidesmis sp. LEGE 11477]